MILAFLKKLNAAPRSATLLNTTLVRSMPSVPIRTMPDICAITKKFEDLTVESEGQKALKRFLRETKFTSLVPEQRIAISIFFNPNESIDLSKELMGYGPNRSGLMYALGIALGPNHYNSIDLSNNELTADEIRAFGNGLTAFAKESAQFHEGLTHHFSCKTLLLNNNKIGHGDLVSIARMTNAFKNVNIKAFDISGNGFGIWSTRTWIKHLPRAQRVLINKDKELLDNFENAQVLAYDIVAARLQFSYHPPQYDFKSIISSYANSNIVIERVNTIKADIRLESLYAHGSYMHSLRKQYDKYWENIPQRSYQIKAGLK